MASTITVTNVVRKNNRLYIQFSDGDEREGTRKQMREWLQQYISDDESVNILKAIAIARGLRIAADADTADDLDLLIGKTLTFNRGAAQNIVRIV